MSAITSNVSSQLASLLAKAITQSVQQHSSRGTTSHSASGTGANALTGGTHAPASRSPLTGGAHGATTPHSSSGTGINALTGDYGSASRSQSAGHCSPSSLSLPGSSSGSTSSGSTGSGSTGSGSAGSGSTAGAGAAGGGLESAVEELVKLLQPLLQQLTGGAGAGAGADAINSGSTSDPSGLGGASGASGCAGSTSALGGAGGASGSAGSTSALGGAGGASATGSTGSTASTLLNGPGGQYTGSGQAGALGSATGTQSGIASTQSLFPSHATSQMPGPTDCSAGSNVSSTQHDVHYSDYGSELAQNKQQMQAALDPMQASGSERAFLTAISLQESTKLNGNSDPNCFSIYNMNDKMIKDVTQKYGLNITPQELNDPQNQGKATQVALLALREYGPEGFLAYERGGPTAYEALKNGQGPNLPGAQANWMDSYYSTFQARFNAIQKDPTLLTDSRRPETSAG